MFGQVFFENVDTKCSVFKQIFPRNMEFGLNVCEDEICESKWAICFPHEMYPHNPREENSICMFFTEEALVFIVFECPWLDISRIHKGKLKKQILESVYILPV